MLIIGVFCRTYAIAVGAERDLIDVVVMKNVGTVLPGRIRVINS